MYVFIFGRAGSSLLHRLSFSCREWGLLSSQCAGFSSQGTGSRAQGFTAVVAGWLRCPGHMGSSWIRDRTHVSCIGRRTLYHRATREAWVSSSSLRLEQVLDPRESERNNAYRGGWGRSSGLSTVELRRCCFYQFHTQLPALQSQLSQNDTLAS